MKGIWVIIAAIAGLFITLASCDIINPPEDIPSYIRIDTFLVEVTDIDQGSASHLINNCYVSAGGSNLGIFELPFVVPSLETGLQTLTIRPGIKLHGISASRIDYPFFEPYIIDIELHENEIHQITPSTTYKEECKFTWMENFEDPGISLTYPDYSDTLIIVQRDVVKDGRSSGVIFIDEENAFFEANSADEYELPQNGSPVLLEFDYLNNNGFDIGMYLNEGGLIEWYNLVHIKPSTIWKRFYVDIGQTATRQSQTDLFRMGIRVFHEPDNNENGYIYLDNIKLIHF